MVGFFGYNCGFQLVTSLDHVVKSFANDLSNENFSLLSVRKLISVERSIVVPISCNLFYSVNKIVSVERSHCSAHLFNVVTTYVTYVEYKIVCR